MSDIDISITTIGDPRRVSFVQAARQRLQILFSTPSGTRPFRRIRFAPRVLELLFEPFADVTARALQHEMHIACETWEPALQIQYTDILVELGDDATYYVTIRLPVFDDSINLTFKHQ